MNAVGIIRVSRVGGREGESFASPSIQRERIEAACEREGLNLLRVHEELDVSGGKSLAKRRGLSEAVESIEAGEAQVIVAAYFDRLYRSLATQAEVGKRVEAAGGRILTVDAGYLGEGTSSEWVDGAFRGVMAEFYRRQAKDRSGEAQRRTIERGVPILTHVPPGYYKGEDGKLLIHPTEGPVIARAFQMRAEGCEIRDLKALMSEHGIDRAWSTIRKMLMSTLYLGQIKFGELVHENAHEALVDEDTWRRVQTHKPAPGRPAKSPLLLARLKVLRCGSCGAAMIASRQKQRGKFFGYYKCPQSNDCKAKATISEKIIDAYVIEKVRTVLADVEGRASAQASVREAERAQEAAENAFKAAIEAFTGMEDVSEAQTRLSELRQVRDDARERVDELDGNRTGVVMNADKDWESLSLDEKRTLIRATVHSATVLPGRGTDRVQVKFVGSWLGKQVEHEGRRKLSGFAAQRV